MAGSTVCPVTGAWTKAIVVWAFSRPMKSARSEHGPKSAVEAGHGVCFLSSLAVKKELRLGTLATAEVAGLDPVRDFYSVRLATRSRRRLTDAFLAWCRVRVAADFGAAPGDGPEEGVPIATGSEPG